MPWHIAHKTLHFSKNLLFESFSSPLVCWLTKCYFLVFICVRSRACYGVDLQSLWLHIHLLSGNSTPEKSIIIAHEYLNGLYNWWSRAKKKMDPMACKKKYLPTSSNLEKMAQLDTKFDRKYAKFHKLWMTRISSKGEGRGRGGNAYFSM